MILRSPRLLLTIIGIGCVVLGLTKDYLVDGQAGFGLYQFIVALSGLILLVAVHRTPKDQSLRSDWLRLIVIFSGGGGLALGLGLDYLIDGHWMHFWKLQTVVLAASSWIILIGVLRLHRYNLVWTIAAGMAVVFSFVATIETSLLKAPYLWASFFGFFSFLLLFFASRKASLVRAINFNLAFIFFYLPLVSWQRIV